MRFPMARLILLTLTLLGSVPAYAEWVLVSSSENMIVYMDPDTVRRKENIVKVWDLEDFKTLQTRGAISFLSTKSLMMYDCTEEQYRILAIYEYPGQMGSGTPVSSFTDPSKWVPVMPGSVGYVKWRILCEPNLPKK